MQPPEAARCEHLGERVSDLLLREGDGKREVRAVARHGRQVDPGFEEALRELTGTIGAEVEEDRRVLRGLKPGPPCHDDGLDELVRQPDRSRTTETLKKAPTNPTHFYSQQVATEEIVPVATAPGGFEQATVETHVPTDPKQVKFKRLGEDTGKTRKPCNGERSGGRCPPTNKKDASEKAAAVPAAATKESVSKTL